MCGARSSQEEKARKELRTKERLARNDRGAADLSADSRHSRQAEPSVGHVSRVNRRPPSKGASPKVAAEAAADSIRMTTATWIGGDDDIKEPAIDPERDESFNILDDLINLSRGPKTASIRH